MIINPGFQLINLIQSGEISFRRNHLRIIDFGFQEPGSIFELYHKIGFESYIGVDIISEDECSVQRVTETGTVSVTHIFPATIYSQYLDYCNCQDYQPISFSKFNETFCFYWNTDVLEFINKTHLHLKKINLAIVSNLLHKKNIKPLDKSVLNWIEEGSTDDLIIYISLMPDSYPYKDEEADSPYSEKQISELLNGFKVKKEWIEQEFKKIILIK